jgi:hypothetical protein
VSHDHVQPDGAATLPGEPAGEVPQAAKVQATETKPFLELAMRGDLEPPVPKLTVNMRAQHTPNYSLADEFDENESGD